ncbi:hypothetical protein R1sor_013755 [Riccia sorocarpa]|uniref:DUF7869 domain-containing protein n=1 Tax=Riccia sorocarpa TaxID=122646 RepID=A0ABD3HBL2_9MARC
MISILTGICGSTLLPYPNDGAETVNEAVGGYVLWDRCAARPADEENGQHFALSNEASSSKKFKLIESSIAIIPYIGGISEYFVDSSSRGDISPDEKEEQARDPNLLQYKDRNTWKWKGVRIFRKGAAEEEIAKGRIIFPSSSASVAGVLVGEENVGIIVLEVSDSVNLLVLQQELPNFTFGQPHLCRWPICSLRIEENGEILGDLYSAYEDADFVRKTQHPQAGPRKRPYFSTKRKLKTEEERLSDRLKRKVEKKLLDADVRKDMIKRCSCRQRCCQSWSVEEVKEVRKEIYGVKFEKKLDLIYQKINASQGREDGLLLCYNVRFVCPPAFWQFHGVSKSSYYLYRNDSKKGAKQGFHGNTGTYKPRESTIHAEAVLKKILLEMSEPMPHLNFDNSNNNGTDSLYHRLPSCYDKQDIYTEHSIRMENRGGSKLSRDSLLRRETSSSESGLLDKPFNKLPPTFYIQLDNSGKDNKNWVMMAFFSELSLLPIKNHSLLGWASNHAATEDIVTYLKAYIKHIKSIRDKTNSSSECYETDSSIIAYWENIKSLLEEPKGWATNAGLPLKEGFWPRTNHGTGYKRPGNQIIIISTPEVDILAQETEEELAKRNQLFVGNLVEMERE